MPADERGTGVKKLEAMLAGAAAGPSNVNSDVKPSVKSLKSGASSSASASSSGGRVAVGGRVVLHGLVSRNDLNGKQATVREFQQQFGRWMVDLNEAPYGELLVKPVNLIAF